MELPVDREGSSSGEAAKEEEKEESEREDSVRTGCRPRASQDPYEGGIEEEEEEEEEEGGGEEEEEEERQAKVGWGPVWSDLQLERGLREFLEGGEGRSSHEEEQRQAMLSTGFVSEPHTRHDGTGGAGGCSGPSPACHRRSEGGQLLRPPHFAQFQRELREMFSLADPRPFEGTWQECRPAS